MYVCVSRYAKTRKNPCDVCSTRYSTWTGDPGRTGVVHIKSRPKFCSTFFVPIFHSPVSGLGGPETSHFP